MPLPITEFKVLIAGPGDVKSELKQVEAALNKWNDFHSERTGIRLKPVHWKQARPGLNEDAQATINRQIVDGCDAGIAVFGARIGTKTPRMDSGTIEEIEQLSTSSRDVMIYFFEGKKNIGDIDPDQLAKVKALKSSLRPRGLLGTFTSLPDLANQLDRHVISLGYVFADRVAASVQKTAADGEDTESIVTTTMMVSALKESLSKNQPIVTHDLVMAEVDRVREALERDGSYPVGSDLSPEQVIQALPELEILSERLMTLFVEGGRWAERSNLEPWTSGLARLCELPQPEPHGIRPGFKINLHRYPALLAVYAGGITALATGRYDFFAQLLAETSIRDCYRNSVPMVLALNTSNIIEEDLAKSLPGWKGRWTPFSLYLSSNEQLRSAVGAYVTSDEAFIAAFDRFEYLLGVLHWDQSGKQFSRSWAPAGRFVWIDHNRDWNPERMPVIKSIWAELDRDGGSWPLLKTGLFNGSLEEFLEVARSYNTSLLTRMK
jgi:hypothetical protein